jgi:hypothetical protein
MWAGLTREFNNLLAARIFMGIGGSAADAVAPDVVGEVFFIHQRGRAMVSATTGSRLFCSVCSNLVMQACYTVFLACGSLVGGASGSYIVAMRSYEWLHWTNVILSAITLLLCFLFQPETLFDRAMSLAIASHGDTQDSSVEKTTTGAGIEDVESTLSSASFTFARSLKMVTYRPGLLRRFATPFLTLRFPGVWLVMLWYAGLVGGIVTVSSVGPQMVASPPYLWGRNAGLINIGGIIGTLLGTIYCYLVADFSIKRHAKKEIHGFAEPEARLKTALPGLFLATTGLWVFGFSGQNPGGSNWIGLQFGQGMLAFGLMQVGSLLPSLPLIQHLPASLMRCLTGYYRPLLSDSTM